MLLIHSKYMHLEPFPPLNICNDLVQVHTSLSAAHNLGVFYEYLTMKKQVSAVSQCGFFHFRNIAKSKCCPCIHHQHDGLMQLTVVWPP